MKPLLAALLLALALSLGCYETKYTLSDPGSAKVDKPLVGDYEQADAAGPADKQTAKVRLVVRNLDDRHYFAEWIDLSKKDKDPKDDDDKAPLRMIAFSTDVKGVTFVHLRELTDDGQVPEKHLIMRVALSADKNTLTLRNLSEEFFKTQTIESDEQLRQVVEAHVNDEAMYEKDTATLTRVAVKK